MKKKLIKNKIIYIIILNQRAFDYKNLYLPFKNIVVTE